MSLTLCRSFARWSDRPERLARYDRILDNARLRRALAAARARADRLEVELATLRGMNHMCTALANRVGAYNDDG